jgi:tRNA modification GTPase
LALIEAGIDFSDEGDVPAELIGPAFAKVTALRGEIEEVLAAQGRSERLRDGLVVAIAGPPNVGKSTLINQLARREVAIVSPHAGTTRDVIEVQLDLDGYPVTVIDTAGIRDTEDPVEQEGVRRAQTRAAAADLVLWLVEHDTHGPPAAGDAPVWMVRNKIDLDALNGDAAGMRQTRGSQKFEISAARGDGMSELVAALVGFAQICVGSDESGLISRERQRTLLREAAASLQRSIGGFGTKGEELVAEDLRAAAQSLGRLLGRVDVEDILDKIFREFCVGK